MESSLTEMLVVKKKKSEMVQSHFVKEFGMIRMEMVFVKIQRFSGKMQARGQELQPSGFAMQRLPRIREFTVSEKLQIFVQ